MEILRHTRTLERLPLFPYIHPQCRSHYRSQCKLSGRCSNLVVMAIPLIHRPPCQVLNASSSNQSPLPTLLNNIATRILGIALLAKPQHLPPCEVVCPPTSIAMKAEPCTSTICRIPSASRPSKSTLPQLASSTDVLSRKIVNAPRSIS